MSSIVLDTSVWIEYFRANPAYFDTCQELLESGSVATVDVIFAELMQGAKGKREIQLINGYYESIPKLDRSQLIYEAGIFSQNEGLINKSIGLIDSIIIYATLTNNLQLWSLDKNIIGFMEKNYPCQLK